MPFPRAGELPVDMIDLIRRLAALWAESPSRPRPTTKACQHWAALIKAWAEDDSLPLYVRKGGVDRGSVTLHESGRQLVPTDNSPAHWAFACAVLGETPTLDDIRAAMAEDRIPVAMVLKGSERNSARYKCLLSQAKNPASRGWKIAHIQPVGLRSRGLLMGISELKVHFRKLMIPENMFVVPVSYAGLGELPEFCTAMGALIKQT